MDARKTYSFACPCCAFQTLTEQAGYDICLVCWWEDDGQDDPHADEVWGGPNYQYSLTAARANFAAHGHMYDSGKGIAAVEQPTPTRRALLDYVQSMKDKNLTADAVMLAALVDADRETMIAAGRVSSAAACESLDVSPRPRT